MNTKSLDIRISVSNELGTKRTSLAGFAFLDSGFLSGKLLHTDGLSKEEEVLITAFSFTGCPIAARTSRADLNPWVSTNGSYRSERVLTSDLFQVRSALVSKGMGHHIEMDLQLQISGQVTGLAPIIRPFQEHIIQAGIGLLNGKFSLSFGHASGPVEAIAETHYKLDIQHEVAPVWRNITILTSADERCLNQVEQIDLYGDQDEAQEDLVRKVAVAVPN